MNISRILFIICLAISFQGVSQNPQKTSLRTDTSVIIPGAAGNNALIRRADSSNAGVMSAADKKKLDRVEFVSSFNELRAVNNVNTSTTYRLMYNKTVGDFYFDPSDPSSVDDTAMIVVTRDGKRLKRFVENRVDARWFGANPAPNGLDDYPYLQKAINWCLQNRTQGTLYIPAGEYLLSKGLLLRKDINADGKTEFVSLDIIGDKISGTDNDANGGETVLLCADITDFGIGIQKGKTMAIKNIAFRGSNTAGYKINDMNIGEAKTADFLSPGVRNNKYSPYAAIVIDPFGTSEVLGQNRYPQRTALYTETSNGGSSAIAIEGCFIRGFAVGIMNSPNGFTQNAEGHTIEDIWVSYCVSGIANGQSQARTVFCKNIKCWGGTMCVFDHLRYGNGTSSAMYVEVANIAGPNKYLVATTNWGIGYNHQFKDVHIESLYAIGGDIEKGGNIGNISFKNCQIDLTGENSGVQKRAPVIAWCNVLELQDSYIGYYSASDPALMFCNAGLVLLRNCSGSTISTLSTYENSVYTQFSHHGDKPYYTMNNANGIANNIQLSPGIEVYKNGYLGQSGTGFQLKQKYCGKALNTYTLSGTFSPVSINTDKRTAVFKAGNQIYKCAPGAWVISNIKDEFGNPAIFCMGIVASVDVNAQTITISNLSSKVTSSFNNGLYMMQLAQLHARPAFYIGDLTASTATIKNIEGDFGALHTMKVGQYFNHPAFVPGTYITAVTDKSITLSTNALFSETGAFVLNETNWENVGLNGETQATFNSFYNQTVFKEGDLIRIGYANNSGNLDTDKTGFVCVKAGMFNTSRPPKFKPLYATTAVTSERAITSISTNTTLNKTHDIVKVTAAGAHITITLPGASSCPGKTYTIKRTDNSKNTCTVAGKIDGAPSFNLSAQYKYITVISNGVDWDIIGNN
jgi:hypothetical protein